VTKKILVCGGRDFTPKKSYELVRDSLDPIIFDREWVTKPDNYGNCLPNVIIISGGANGIDKAAIDYAVVNWCVFREYKADWNKFKKAAGPIRNQEMLDKEDPDLVVAIPSANSKGTWDMVRRAKKAGKEVIVIETTG
jgi:hypothetical protein